MTAAQLPPPPPLARLLADGPIALFLDFDGTLIELAETPGAIVVPQGLASALANLSERLGGRLALVSGRSVINLEQHCGPIAVDCAGSHGAERRRADGSALGVAPQALPEALRDAISAFGRAAGVDYEAKPHGAALHSRKAPEMEERCAAFMTGLAAEHGLVAKHGKRVAELVSPGADKGAAVRAFMAETPFTGSRPVFVGDDLTDEDGFAASADLGGFGVAVGARPSRIAQYGLAGPAEVHQWLAL